MTWDSETTAAPVIPTGLNGYTRKSSSVRSHAFTMSRIARSTTSVESRFWQSQSSRIRCRPTLFMPSPPPENHRRNGASEPFDPVLRGPDHHAREFHSATIECIADHCSNDLVSFLSGAGRVLENHPVAVFTEPDTNHRAQSFPRNITVACRVNRWNQRARIDRDRCIEQYRAGWHDTADFYEVEIADPGAEQRIIKRVDGR